MSKPLTRFITGLLRPRRAERQVPGSCENDHRWRFVHDYASASCRMAFREGALADVGARQLQQRDLAAPSRPELFTAGPQPEAHG